MLRDYASFNNNDNDFFYPGMDIGGMGMGMGMGSSSNVNNNNNNYYDTSTNWRKNQGYNLVQPIPPELGGTIPYRDAETNPYYDPGWAQSVRRDSSSTSNGYGGYGSGYGGGGGGRTTYPGMTNPRRTEKIYTNPTNPYYDPVWSQSYVRNDVPIRDADHTMYYAPGYDRNNNMYNGGGIGGYYYGPGAGAGVGGRGRMMMDEFEDGFYGGGGGGGYYGRGGMGPMYATPPSPTTNTIARRSSGGKKTTDAVCNTNSLMR